MTTAHSFAPSAESTVFLQMSQSTTGGGNGGGGNGGFGGGGGRPPPSTQPPSPQFSTDPFQFRTSSSSSPAATTTSILAATNSAAASSQNKSLPLGLIIGASVGGMVLGALIVCLFFLVRRRSAQRKAQSGQILGAIPYKLDEEKAALDAPLRPLTANAKIMDWMNRNRVVSVSTISSFSSPTVLESSRGARTSVGARTSISAYSQASAVPDPKPEEGGVIRPPGLSRINE